MPQNGETGKLDRWSSEPPHRECYGDKSSRRPTEWYQGALAGTLFHEERKTIGRSQLEGTARMLRRMGVCSGSVSASSSMAISMSLSSSGENPADWAELTEVEEVEIVEEEEEFEVFEEGGQSGEATLEASEASEAMARKSVEWESAEMWVDWEGSNE